jgi:hypothetical protein
MLLEIILRKKNSLLEEEANIMFKKEESSTRPNISRPTPSFKK